MDTQKLTPKLVPPERVTLAWLFHNVPFPVWSLLAGLLVAAFVSGVSLGRTNLANDLLGKTFVVTRTESPSADLPPSVLAELQQLTKDHTARLAQLNEAYLREQGEVGNDANLDSWRATHAAAAKTIQEAMVEENHAYTAKVQALKSFAQPNTK